MPRITASPKISGLERRAGIGDGQRPRHQPGGLGERWIGKIVSPGPSAGELEDVRRNILSILRRIAPDVHVPATTLRLFVLHGVEGKLFVADEPPTVEDDDHPAMRRVMFG